jgi:hypothetical protein
MDKILKNFKKRKKMLINVQNKIFLIKSIKFNLFKKIVMILKSYLVSLLKILKDNKNLII